MQEQNESGKLAKGSLNLGSYPKQLIVEVPVVLLKLVNKCRSVDTCVLRTETVMCWRRGRQHWSVVGKHFG